MIVTRDLKIGQAERGSASLVSFTPPVDLTDLYSS